MAKRNLEPGMDAPQLDKDRAGYRTTTTMVTGGEEEDVGECAGPEVGNPYSNDPMGEDREMITWTESDTTGGHVDGGKPLPTDTTKQGGTMAKVPQRRDY